MRTFVPERPSLRDARKSRRDPGPACEAAATQPQVAHSERPQLLAVGSHRGALLQQCRAMVVPGPATFFSFQRNPLTFDPIPASTAPPGNAPPARPPVFRFYRPSLR